MHLESPLGKVRDYYTCKLAEHGTTPAGVDWNSSDSQRLRFEQLLKVCGAKREFTITDYGAGYGALIDTLVEKGYRFQYRGFDISREMVETGRSRYAQRADCEFVAVDAELVPTDFVVASGIFNVTLGTSLAEWKKYVLQTLARLNELALSGFAFNVLTKYSDPERMRPDLYYADPCFLFDHCKRNFSRNVALLHDYELYEFTMIVRK